MTSGAQLIMNNKTTAENLVRKFDQGEDVMDYFDPAKASRPLLAKERIKLDIPHWMILEIDRVARRKGMPRQAQIKEWLSQKLRACFENRSGKGLRARRGGWRGATKENIPRGSSTEEQRRQPPRPAARPPELFSKHTLKEEEPSAT
jgi:hypothetical protein